MSDDLKRAGDELQQQLTELCEQLPLIPDDIIESVHSAGLCEDGKTFMLQLDLADGQTMIVSACPGEPLSVRVQ